MRIITKKICLKHTTPPSPPPHFYAFTAIYKEYLRFLPKLLVDDKNNGVTIALWYDNSSFHARTRKQL